MNFYQEPTLNDSKVDITQIADSIAVMKKQEVSTYKCADYLNQLSVTKDDNTAQMTDEEIRLRMIEWCVQVADYCKFSRETVWITVSYLDRFLSTERGSVVLKDKRQFQLATICCLYIAIKLFEQKKFGVSFLVELGRGIYSEEDIATMERDILSSLNWRTHPPTPLSFLHHLLFLLPESIHPSVKTFLLDFSRVQTELAVYDYFFTQYSPSIIAIASILNTIDNMEYICFPSCARKEFCESIAIVLGIKMTDSRIRDIRVELQKALADICIPGPQIETYHAHNTFVGENGMSSSGVTSPVCVSRRKVSPRYDRMRKRTDDERSNLD